MLKKIQQQIGKITFFTFLFYAIWMIFSAWYYRVDQWNLNKSIGWSYDFSNFSFWIDALNLGVFLIFPIGYGIIYFRRKNPNFYLSIIHIGLLFVGLVFSYYGLGYYGMITGFSALIFIINMFTKKERISSFNDKEAVGR